MWMSDLSALVSASESNTPPLSLSELPDLQRQLSSYVQAIEACELEASAYLHGCFRGGLAVKKILGTGSVPKVVPQGHVQGSDEAGHGRWSGLLLGREPATSPSGVVRPSSGVVRAVGQQSPGEPVQERPGTDHSWSDSSGPKGLSDPGWRCCTDVGPRQR